MGMAVVEVVVTGFGVTENSVWGVDGAGVVWGTKGLNGSVNRIAPNSVVDDPMVAIRGVVVVIHALGVLPATHSWKSSSLRS